MTELSLRAFAPDAEGVDPALIPQKFLASGPPMPGIGLGTFGSDRYSNQEIAEAVVGAASVGYRHLDCDRLYGKSVDVHSRDPHARSSVHNAYMQTWRMQTWR